ncbi:MAG: bifunctional 4-hydroxy-2-oxoglutarate aldolase/2-dehydro-3-deoxy-phosphogluconate aldolase [Clostridia bacterium]|nr:bifunctional 4-hydroxy-2-oxoglutarate aldolase/2-dehydro-3-deoxy-phosphogluconate aldolase [Clostridia bacterium]
MSTMEMIKEIGVVPVVKIDNIEDTQPLMEALIRGNLPVAEITFRTACAEEAIRIASKNYPDMLVGAGTVITSAQAIRAIEAGAKFIVGPGYSATVAKVCQTRDIPYLPGCVTPTEIITALDAGIDTVKFFPASVYGGLKAIKALAAPFTTVKFIPTGGVSADNLAEFLAFPKIVACGGSWMVADALVKAKNWAEIERLANEAVEIAKKRN